MPLLLNQKYTYTIFEPADHIRSRLMSITKIPWHNIEINLAAKVNEDNTFQLYSKLSFPTFSLFNMSPHAAVIKGNFEQQGNEETIIHAEIRPSYIILLAFYLFLILFVFKLVNLFVSNTNDWSVVITLFIIFISLRGLIYFSADRLKNQFERIMPVKAE